MSLTVVSGFRYNTGTLRGLFWGRNGFVDNLFRYFISLYNSYPVCCKEDIKMIYKEEKIHNKTYKIFCGSYDRIAFKNLGGFLSTEEVFLTSLKEVISYLESVQKNNKELPKRIYLFDDFRYDNLFPFPLYMVSYNSGLIEEKVIQCFYSKDKINGYLNLEDNALEDIKRMLQYILL